MEWQRRDRWTLILPEWFRPSWKGLGTYSSPSVFDLHNYGRRTVR